MRTGVTFYDDTDFTLDSGFVAAPAGTGAFTTTSDFDDVLFDVAAGVTLFRADGTALTFVYDGQFAGDTEAHAATFKGSFAF